MARPLIHLARRKTGHHLARPIPSGALQPYSPSMLSGTHEPVRCSQRPLALRLFLVLLMLILISGITLGVLVCLGQTDLVAWIIVGAILTVVFGTPLLCVIGLISFFIWSMACIGRARRR